MTLEEMEAARDAVVAALDSSSEIHDVEAVPFEPGTPPSIMFTHAGEALYVELNVL